HRPGESGGGLADALDLALRRETVHLGVERGGGGKRHPGGGAGEPKQGHRRILAGSSRWRAVEHSVPRRAWRSAARTWRTAGGAGAARARNGCHATGGPRSRRPARRRAVSPRRNPSATLARTTATRCARSEERRVGDERESRGA